MATGKMQSVARGLFWGTPYYGWELTLRTGVHGCKIGVPRGQEEYLLGGASMHAYCIHVARLRMTHVAGLSDVPAGLSTDSGSVDNAASWPLMPTDIFLDTIWATWMAVLRSLFL